MNLFENYKKENVSNLINGMFAYVLYDYRNKKFFFRQTLKEKKDCISTRMKIFLYYHLQ